MTTATAIRRIAAMCPLSPMTLDVYARFREPQEVTCPETGGDATIKIDAEMAAATFAVGMPGILITRCSKWPRECGRGCLSQIN